MKHAFMLLNPLQPELFGTTLLEMTEALEEFGCSYIISEGNNKEGSEMYFYATAPTLEALQQMVNAVDLEGTIVSVTQIFDPQLIIEG